jgi:penicillin-binding protein 1C
MTADHDAALVPVAQRGARSHRRVIAVRVAVRVALGLAALFAALATLVAAAFLGAWGAGEPAPFAAVKQQHEPSDATLLDRHGEAVATRRIDATVRRLDWVPLAQVSPALTQAVLAAEDRRFHEHGGVDWLAVGAAWWSNLRSAGASRGASSISMQVAALLDEDLRRGEGGRGLATKARQMLAARALERRWSKPQILEAYLNRVVFRGELQGVTAASWGLFGKHPGGLDRHDAAILAALIRAPNASDTVLAARACAVLSRTHPDVEGCPRDALKTRLARAGRNPRPVASIAPHLAQRLLSEQGGAQRVGSIDANVQRAAQAALHEQLVQLGQHGVEDGAVVVLDNRSGEVLAYVGSSGAFSQAAQVDAAVARRQAGSTLKPFLYALALDQRRLTAASLLDDAPLGVATDAGLYVPQNYDRRFAGPVSVRRALASSLNIPAVRTLQLVGVAEFHAKLDELGLALDGSADHHGVALALGSADVRLVDLTNAYRALANGGKWSPLRFDRASVAEHRDHSRDVIGPQAAWLIGHMLSDNAARAHTFGFDSVLATPFWTAVKTGTSKDMRDNWCIGWSARYTVGVWVGNASGRPMAQVSGVSGAAPAWADVMRWLHARAPSREPERPAGLLARRVMFDDGIEATRDEWFAADVAPPPTSVAALDHRDGQTRTDDPPLARVTLAPASNRPAIVDPQNGTLIAWDPDIPIASSALMLRHSGDASARVTWRLNGRVVPAARVAVSSLRPGRNIVELVARDGRVLDRANVELRGRPVLRREGRVSTASRASGSR